MWFNPKLLCLLVIWCPSLHLCSFARTGAKTRGNRHLINEKLENIEFYEKHMQRIFLYFCNRFTNYNIPLLGRKKNCSFLFLQLQVCKNLTVTHNFRFFLVVNLGGIRNYFLENAFLHTVYIYIYIYIVECIMVDCIFMKN